MSSGHNRGSLRPIDRLLELLALAFLIFSIAYIVWHYEALPERVAVHFNMKGEADGWGGKGTLYVVPIIFGFTWLLLAVLSRYLPKEHFNYPGKYSEEKSEALYPLAKTLLHGMQLSMGIIAGIASWTMVSQSLDPNLKFNDLWLILGVILLPIVIYFYYYLKRR
jgi:uncharacterized membrane protein